MSNISVGSICSGIEAASIAWGNKSFDFSWFSEISPFPSKLLSTKYPEIPNLGDMCEIPDRLVKGEIPAPDLICGGTPCQAFSLAGWQKGLTDDRGNLTLKFVDIINANDRVRLDEKKNRTIVFWENVEGVLRDKTNAFGCFLASLAGYDAEINIGGKWPQSGLIRGPIRNIAWRIIDAKYFGLPQQRKRLYVVAGGKDFNPEDVLFEVGPKPLTISTKRQTLHFNVEGHSMEVFRSYTDCLYSAYGTKWNGNAAAYNGSLFVSQNGRLRRLTPLECERLMGFPDNYTDLPGAKLTSRYQAVGNSWAVPVIEWIGHRILETLSGNATSIFQFIPEHLKGTYQEFNNIWFLGKELIPLRGSNYLNGTTTPCNPVEGEIQSVLDTKPEEKLYITPVGCKGILRRKQERGLKMNARLEDVLLNISSTWSDKDIEAVSRLQPRGKFSESKNNNSTSEEQIANLDLWDVKL
ncbi:MAG: DNA cytosine methyltransferase [Polaromonas sp.]|nr:DNA cytosine methyltransferase [Polaromonas sp.]